MPFIQIILISIHALREEGDLTNLTAYALEQVISIHALREEGDQEIYAQGTEVDISIHALREEGDAVKRVNHFVIAISIHALREEGDILMVQISFCLLQFLSTPSARRAT